ncbi:MAG: gamma-glutamylcyclotransferase family protein [Gemmatimonadaceae bacterium]
MPVPLFVYGTLKRSASGGRHRLLRSARFVDVASMSGSLYDLGSYPGAVRQKSGGRVFGELYEIPDEAAHKALRALDRYEGPEFTRRRAYVTLRDGKRRGAWAYLLRKRPPKSARQVDSGRYARKRGAA